MGNRLPAWLSPGVEDLLPFSAEEVRGRWAAGHQNSQLTEEQKHRAAVKRGVTRAAALSPERRTEIARNAALARHARMTPEQASALGRAGGLASAAASTPAQRRARGRRGAKITNFKRWGFGK